MSYRAGRKEWDTVQAVAVIVPQKVPISPQWVLTSLNGPLSQKRRKVRDNYRIGYRSMQYIKFRDESLNSNQIKK